MGVLHTINIIRVEVKFVVCHSLFVDLFPETFRAEAGPLVGLHGGHAVAAVPARRLFGSIIVTAASPFLAT